MSLFDKFKNLFYEEDIKDEIVEEKKQEKEDQKEEKKQEKEEITKEEKKEEPERKIFNNEPTFKFPIAFDDDFDKKEKKAPIEMVEKKFKMPEVPKKEKKEFKPSPMISPIYGIMDGDVKKETSVRDGLLENVDMKLDIDEVRNKVYGTTISREEKYNSKEKETIEKTEINLFFKEEPVEQNEAPIKESIISDSYEEELSYDLNEIDEKIKTIDELLKDTGDKEDLYSLVDKMYKDKEEGDDENDVY